MQLKSTRERLLATTIICGAAAAFAAPAFAQDATAPAAPIQEVVVTGSRIPQPNLTSISPVTAVSNAEIKLEGTTRIEDLLNSLPQVFADQGSSITNGATGTATVNLRGLGAQRTLVLINGRRLLPGDPLDPVADLNNIPAQLVERVDIDTGGASAVYGSDAISGVVNFIMKKNFTGVQLDAQYSLYQHDNDDSNIQNINKASGYTAPSGSTTDGYTTSVSATIGVNAPDGKGNFTAYATYRNVDAVLEGKRDYSNCTLAESGSTFACGGSITTNPALISLLNSQPYTTVTNGKTVTYAPGQYDLNDYVLSGTGANTSFAPFGSNNYYNYGPLNYLQRPDTRYNVGAYGNYEISPKADVYTELMFMDDDSVAQVAGSGIFYGTPYNIPCNYPGLTASELSTIQTLSGSCTPGGPSTFTIIPGRRNVEGSGRTSDLRHTAYRIVLGMKGDLDKAWSYDTYLQYGTTIFQDTEGGYFSTSKVANALSNCTINPNDGCVPYNLFQNGGVTQAQLNYLTVPGLTKGSTTEQVADFTLTGKLGEYGIKSPFATDGVGVALGTEYRREYINFTSDEEVSSGDLEGAGGASPPISGSFDVYELFAELRAPLVQDRPWVKSLDLNAAYRFSDYSTAGVTDTYEVGLEYAPVDDIRFRGSFQRAVRAPNVLELFSPQNVVLGFTNDPCAGSAPVYTAAQCARTGVTAAQYGLITANPASQYNTLQGGNPQLQPEVADTYSAGLVWTPSQLPGFSLTVDYFNIFVDGVISGAAAPNTVIGECATTGNSYYCGLIHRDSNGSLWETPQGYVTDTNVNAGSLQTSGMDFEAAYRLPLSRFGLDYLGSLSFNFNGTYLASLTSEPVPGGEKFDCEGLYGPTCGTPNPRWRHKFRTTWNTPWFGSQISLQWRYFSDVRVDAASANPLLSNPADVYPVDSKIGAQNYIDLTYSVKIKDNYQFRVGVENVFDEEPPLIGSAICPGVVCNANTFPQVYDSLGRYIFVGLTATY